MPTSPGRPRKASRELLQEAAFELFQLRGYRATSVEQIAKTAGFSRATFFNFFSSKAELFWVETDILIAALSQHLEQQLEQHLDQHLDHGEAPTIEAALLEHAATLNSAKIPWALQNFQVIDGTDDLIASGANRVLELNRVLQKYMVERSHRLGPVAESESESERENQLALRASTAALTATVLTALLDWIRAGVRRGELTEHLKRVLPYGG